MSRASSSERVVWVEGLNFSNIRNHLGDVGRLAQGAFDFVVVAMADENQRITLLGEFDRLDVNLGDQGAGGVDHLQVACLAQLADGRRNPVRGIDDPLTLWHFFDFVDEDGALFRQFIDDIAVMDDLAANVDGRPKGFESDADNIDGANHTGAEAARLEEKNGFVNRAGSDIRAGCRGL